MTHRAWGIVVLLVLLLPGCYTPVAEQKKRYQEQMGRPLDEDTGAPSAQARKPKRWLPLNTVVSLPGKTQHLNVRQTPSVSAARVFQLSPGQTVTLLRQKDGWFFLREGENEGWAFGAYLRLKTGPLRAYTVGEEGLTLFKKPSLESDAALMLKTGDRFLMEHRTTQEGWRRVLLADGGELFTR